MKTSAAKLAANAAWRARHREEHLRRRRQAYAANGMTDAQKERAKELRESKKDEKREYDRAYREANADKCRENDRRKVKANPAAYQAIRNNYKHRRRAIEALGIESSVLAYWTAEQPKACFYCGDDCIENFHVDHFMPLSKGGAHVLTNLRISCASCNLSKNASDPLEWIDRVNAEMFSPKAVAA